MKKPEEIKKGLVEAIEEASWVVEGGDAHDLIDAVENAHASMADALSLIQQLESQVPRWISVEERLPPLGEVLICTRGNYVGVAWFHANGKFETGGGLMLDTKFVSHWMPLPEAPKEDAHE